MKSVWVLCVMSMSVSSLWWVGGGHEFWREKTFVFPLGLKIRQSKSVFTSTHMGIKLSASNYFV